MTFNLDTLQSGTLFFLFKVDLGPHDEVIFKYLSKQKFIIFKAYLIFLLFGPIKFQRC